MKITKGIDPLKCREAAYDPVGDQLDRITKALAYLHQQGIDIGVEGVEQINHTNTVKQRFKKKVTKRKKTRSKKATAK